MFIARLQLKTLRKITLTLALAASVWVANAAPPNVVATSPTHGAAGLNPEDVTRVTVTFDQAMTRGSHSWVGGPPLFPRISGSPTWLDDRTAVLPVKLEAESDYVIGINGPNYTNFKSAAGTPASPSTVIFSTRDWPMPDVDRREAVRLLRDILAWRYSYRDRLGIDWEAEVNNAEDDLLNADSALRFATRVAELLNASEDPHVAVTLGQVTMPSDWRSRREARRDLRSNFNGRTLSRVVRDITKHNAGVISGFTESGAAYLLIPAWSGGSGGAAREALRLLGERGSVERLIIDVRPNGGGAEAQALTFAGTFIGKPTTYAMRRHVHPGAAGGFTEAIPAILEPAPLEGVTPGRVAVLVGPNVMSSCEAFCLMMREAGATLVGEPTLGSTGNPQTHKLPGQITILTPSWIAMDSRGNAIEGKGIHPDISIETDPEDLTAEDPVLAEAIRFFDQP